MITTTEREMKMLIRLGQYTTEYCAFEKEKEQYYISHIKDMSRTTVVTLYLMQSNIDRVIKQICSLVGRLMREGIEFDNECATLVYNYYNPAIKRGLSDLL